MVHPQNESPETETTTEKVVVEGRIGFQQTAGGHDIQEAIRFYDASYDFLLTDFLRPNQRIPMLGDRKNRLCRFCGLSEPNVSFRHKAHAIPESLGNKSLFTNYECDSCNQQFGDSIENDLGIWTKPSRTLSRIRGKKGFPIIKQESSHSGWRIVFDSILSVSQFDDDPIAQLDEEHKCIRFKIKRDSYTPVAVFKAFVKAGLTLLPATELASFRETIEWIMQRDHSRPFIRGLPIYHTFQPGPMPSDLITVALMRRKSNIVQVPFAVFVISFGNDVYQVFLPCPEKDIHLHAQQIYLPPFPTPAALRTTQYGSSRTTKVDLCGRERVTNGVYHACIGFKQIEMIRNESK